MVTAPFNAEAERAAAEAMHDAWCMEGGACPTRDRHVAVTRRDAARVLAAVVPFLAEHFAQAVEADAEAVGKAVFDLVRAFPTPPPFGGSVGWGASQPDVGRAACEVAARAVREAATPTEGDQA